MRKNLKNECVNCIERRRCRDSFSSWIFFIIGLIATIAIRVVTVLIKIDPIDGRIAWYVGIAGFFLFFVYMFRIGQQRARLINRSNLVEIAFYFSSGWSGAPDEYALSRCQQGVSSPMC